MTCYAYRKLGEKELKEYLYEHSLEVAECVRDSWELVGLKRKLRKIYGIDEELVADLITLSALFHDLGKASESIQKECVHECTEFRHHYITSAMLALKIGYSVEDLGLNPDNIEEILRDILENRKFSAGHLYVASVVLPILLHHYSQIKSEFSALISPETKLKLTDECINALTKMTNEVRKDLIKTPIGVKILNALTKNIEKEVELAVIPALRQDLLLGICEYSHEKMMIEAITGLINMCDGRVASKNRH